MNQFHNNAVLAYAIQALDMVTHEDQVLIFTNLFWRTKPELWCSFCQHCGKVQLRIVMPLFPAGPPKVHSGVLGSVFVALHVLGHKITYLTPQCCPVLVTAWSTLIYCL